jgi:hypothetical protein
MDTECEYREYAQECARWAVEVESDEDRDALLEVAKVLTYIALVEGDVVRRPKLRKAKKTSRSYS